MTDLTYDKVIARANTDASYRAGLEDAARICRAQDSRDDVPPCPSGLAAVYLERLARGERP